MAARSNNVVVWFEIPADNMERVVAFYETIMDVRLKREDMGGAELAVFPRSEECAASGCVMRAKPGQKRGLGTMIYLNCDGKLQSAVGRVEKAGGKLRTPVIQLPNNMGSFIHIEDTEGNLVGLHAID